jgi:hypothetical protein
MPRKKRKTAEEIKIEQESAEQLRIDPIAAGERLRSKLCMEAERHLAAAGRAVGDHAITSALLKAMESWRKFVGFSHDMAEASGKKSFEVRAVLHQKAGSEFLRGRILALKHGSGMAVATEPVGREIIQAIRATREPKPGPVYKNLEDCTPEEIEELRNPSPTAYQLEREAMRRREY